MSYANTMNGLHMHYQVFVSCEQQITFVTAIDFRMWLAYDMVAMVNLVTASAL